MPTAKKDETKPLTIQCPVKLHADIKKMAADNFRPMNMEIQRILSEAVEAHKKG